ncbi:hypothetical protein WJX74_003352 [Apatococcus lobatus]|uniref:DUF8204 domain-containing protein n=1 Tax=Apatococcus lobatus TaxID=904363 RepID=A0AAW1RQX3_9CHLO
MPDRRPEASDPDVKNCKTCLGLTYFSQSMHSRGKAPTCIGKPSHLNAADVSPSQPADSVPSGDFKFFCAGFSMYDKSQLPMKDGSSPSASNPAAVELPYCEGIEVVTSAELQHAPAELLRSPTGEAAPPAVSPAGSRPQRPKTWVEDSPGLKGTSLEDFPQKFGASAKKVFNRMCSNANQLATSAKRASDDLMNEFWGRGRDR